MSGPVPIDTYSLVTSPLEMHFGGVHLSVGTGFVWENDQQERFLVTNWHNVSGVDPNTGANLSPTGARPDRIQAHFVSKNDIGRKFKEELLLRDTSGLPNWFVHPQHGKAVDAIALPLRPRQEPSWFAINRLAKDALAVEIGHDVFVLGYPFGLRSGGFPVWKRGSIASEPKLFLGSERYMLIDTASRPGMSGSPVIRRTWGSHPLENGAVNMSSGACTRLVGIYSGRLATKDPLDAQLGLVWPVALIEQIIAAKHRDTGIF